MKKAVLKHTGYYSILTALSFLRAISTYVFIVPNAFAPGGVGGLASLIYNVTLSYNAALAESWLNPAVTIFVLNLPLIILSFKKINRSFSINTTLCVILYAAFMGLFSLVDFPQFAARDADSSVMILAAIAGGVIGGVSLGLMLLLNMSAGGTDIVAKVVYKQNPTINVQWLIFLFDMVVVLLSGVLGFIYAEEGDDSTKIFVRVLTPIFYSIISMYATSKVAEVINNGFESSVVFNIITDKYNEISAAILRDIKRGATILKGEGIFTGEERHIVVCVVRKKQLVALKRLVLSIDNNAFLYINNAREVNGFGFPSSHS
ncbi:MAG: YitT family protein [Clostridia bacterium]